MVRAKFEDDKACFTYSKCDGMSQHRVIVDADWFNAHNTESMTVEELDGLAFADKENSKAEGKISWWGLG